MKHETPAAHNPALLPVGPVYVDPKSVTDFGEMDLAKFRPLNGMILVERFAKQPEGPIIVVDRGDKRKEPTLARVIKSGQGEQCPKTGRRKVTDIPPGTVIAIDKYAGHDVKINGRNYVMLMPVEILAYCPEADTGEIVATLEPEASCS